MYDLSFSEGKGLRMWKVIDFFGLGWCRLFVLGGGLSMGRLSRVSHDLSIVDI